MVHVCCIVAIQLPSAGLGQWRSRSPQPFPDKNLSSQETVSLSSVPAKNGEWGPRICHPTHFKGEKN